MGIEFILKKQNIFCVLRSKLKITYLKRVRNVAMKFKIQP